MTVPPSGPFAVTVPPSVSLLALAAVATGALGAYAFRHRQEPGATPFVLLMLSLTLWSGIYAVGLVTHDTFWRFLLLRTQWLAHATIGLWFLLFALAYTGHDQFLNRRTLALLGVVPGVVIVAVWTNPAHHLLWIEQSVVVVDGLALMNPTFGPIFWMDILYSYSLIVVGSVLILRLVFVSDYLYADQSALLLVGVAAPVLMNVVDVFVLPAGPRFDPTPLAFTVTGGAFGYALFRRKLFDLVPATRQLGRNAAIGQLDTGVIILDNARRVVYCNAAAGEVLDSEPADAVGREVRSLVDESRIDFGAEDALAEIERDGTVYEVRTSSIADRHGREIGRTLVVHDVTARKRRERELAAQRDELATLNDLNAVLRGVNQALVSATSREEIERAVCERVAAADLYRTACIADIATWSGSADRWLIAGDDAPVGLDPPGIEDGAFRNLGGEDAGAAGELPTVPDPGDDGGTWTVVPLLYGRTVFGALGLYTDRDDVSDRERAVLGELGELVGHAINAVETRQLLSSATVVELELESGDAGDPLAALATGSTVLSVAGIVPQGSGTHVAYVRVEDGSVETARERLEAATGSARVVRDTGAEGLLEWQVTGDVLLGALLAHGTNVTFARAEGGQARYDLEIASDADVRSLLDHVDRLFPDTRVVAKRERARLGEEHRALAGDSLDGLTARQREVLEAAYRAGYFRWPRDSTAEEVASGLDIAAPTLHEHIRNAEATLLADLFDAIPERA